MIEKIKKYRFLFEELVKRDFKKKYKRTVIGMMWSLVSPLLMLLVMALVFTNFFGRTTEFYIIYLFSGLVNFNYFSDATNGGMESLVANANIFSKVNVPKYLFLLSRNVQAFINYALTLIIYFIFVAAQGIPFRWSFFLLLYPILCLTAFNIGLGMILSAMYMKFKDIKYLYAVFTQMLMYFSAIFYNIEAFSLKVQYLFYMNPIYVYIRYFRKIVIENSIPALSFHGLCLFFPVVVLLIGIAVYKKNNYKFLYYV
jgi:ABC-2 type transport system permease protein